jgi:IS5 family transposase
MEARLAFLSHAMMKNRSGLIVDACLTTVSGYAERVAALAIIEPRSDGPRPTKLGADRGYDASDFVNELRSMNVRPHMVQKLTLSRPLGHQRSHRPLCSEPARSQAHRGALLLDEGGARARKTQAARHRPGWWAFAFSAAAYNLVRLPKLLATPA